MLAAAIVLPCVFVRPLLCARHPDGHDPAFNVIRLAQVDRCLRAGSHTLRWLPDLANGYGCPLFNFYSPFLYVAAAGFHAVGLSLSGSVKAVYCLGVVLSSVGMFLFVRGWVGPCGALLAATLYVYAPYRAVDVYVRSAWLEHFALAYFPWLLWGADRYTQTRRTGYLALLCFGYAALVLTHTISAYVFTPVLLAYFVVSRLIRRDTPVLRMVCSLAMGVGLCAFFWLPAWAERPFIHAHAMTGGVLDYRRHFLYPIQLVARRWGYGLSVEGPGDSMSFQVGWTHMTFALVSAVLLCAHAPRRIGRWAGFLLVIVVASIAMMFPVSALAWRILPLVRYVQFPWRFLMLAVFCASALGGGLPAVVSKWLGRRSPGASALGRSRRAREAAVSAIAITLVLLEVAPLCRAKYMDPFDDDAFVRDRLIRLSHPWATTSTRGEYVPLWVKEYPASPAAEHLDDPGSITVSDATFGPARYTLRTESGQPARLVFNTFYFPGWQARVDGRRAALGVADRSGRMCLNLPPGSHMIELRFGNTAARLWAKLVSALSAVVAFLAFTVLWRKQESDGANRDRV